MMEASVVCMTVNKRDLVPDLAAAGVGLSYWIEGGSVVPIHLIKTSQKVA